MPQIYTDHTCRLWVEKSSIEQNWDSPLHVGSFPCLIYSGEPTSIEYKSAIARKLIHSGCVFFVCAGQECERWHDTIDDEILIAQDQGIVDEEDTLMTTWHADESLESISFFFVYTTFNPYLAEQPAFKELEGTNYLVLIIGSQNPEQVQKEVIKQIRDASTA